MDHVTRNKINFFLPYFFLLLGSLMRVIPHPYNFAPIAAIALFGSVYLPKRVALILPVAAMVISDVFIGFDSLESRLTVYGSFFLTGLIGLWIRNHKNVATIFAGSILGSVLFFLITNFAYLYEPTMYTHNLQGIVQSYINGLPFFRNTLFGDLFYVGVLFGSYELVKYFSLLRRAKAIGQSHN